MAFENLIALAEEPDRPVLADMGRKYPWIRENIELGERISQWRPRLKALSGSSADQDFEANPTLAFQELQEWRDWKRDKWPIWDKENQAARQALQEAMDKLTAYEAGEINMTPEELEAIVDRRIAAKGLIAASDMDTRLKDGLEKFGNERVLPSINEWGGRVRNIYAKLTPKMSEHAKMFDGETLDPEPVFKYMDEHRIMDPLKAYDEYMAPRMKEREQKLNAEAVEKARKEGVAEGQRISAASSGRAMPVGGGNTAPVGPLISRYRQKFAEKLAAGQTSAEAAPLGKGIIAHAAANRHFEKELAAGQP